MDDELTPEEMLQEEDPDQYDVAVSILENLDTIDADEYVEKLESLDQMFQDYVLNEVNDWATVEN